MGIYSVRHAGKTRTPKKKKMEDETMRFEREGGVIHVDLFSGIGGFALAAKWTGFETVVFCEKDEFCQKVLQKRFGAVIADSKSMGWRNWTTKNKGENTGEINSFGYKAPLLIPEIRDFDGTKWRGATLLTGGFPCQPFSVAGTKKGKEDDRHLWPEMFRIIKESKPRWILAENVPGIIGMELDNCLADLEDEGYETGTLIIPACAVEAPHRRDRIWIIAYSIGPRAGCDNGTINDKRGRGGKDRREGIRPKDGAISPSGSASTNKDAPDSNGFDGNDAGFGTGEIPLIKKAKIQGCDPPDSEIYPERPGLCEGKQGGKRGGRPSNESWKIPWIEVAARFCRVDDGVSNRVHRLKSLGNAIVPQVAAEIMRGIARCVT